MKIKQVKKLLCKYFRTWARTTGLSYWNVSMGFKYGVKERDHNLLLGGYCEADWRYQRARIVMYPKAMQHLTPVELEEAIVHEIIHIFLCEMHEDGIDHEERCATQLQKAMMWVRDIAASEAK